MCLVSFGNLAFLTSNVLWPISRECPVQYGRRATYRRFQVCLDKSLVLGMRLSIHTRHGRRSFSSFAVD